MNWNAMLKRIAVMLLLAVLVLQINPMYAEDETAPSGFNRLPSAEDIRFQQISASGKLYEVTVTYGDDAQIPNGARLQMTEYAADSAEYLNAQSAVWTDMLARGEAVNAGPLGLAALDIAILDAHGNEIEPAAPVRVDLTVKALPDVENLDEIADSLVVRHLVETESGAVFETVCTGGAAAYPGVILSFQTAAFSTFTVEWGSAGSVSNSVSYLWTTAANVNTYQFNDDGTYGGQYSLTTNNLHFMNSSGLGIPGYIFRTPAGETAKGDLYLVYNHTGSGVGDQNVSEADSTFHIYFNYNGSTYADVTVHYVDSAGNAIRRTKTNNATYTGGSVDTRYATGTNTNQTLSNYAGSKSGYTFAGVSEVRPTNEPAHATIHYVDEAGNELTVSNGQPVNDTNGNLNYLIYDVDGYEYAYTYRNTNTTANRITPVLRYQSNRWQYTTSTSQNGTNSWTNLSTNDDIYVVYKPKASVPNGGTPVPKITGAKPDAPTITKGSVVNGDGTNTLSLSVTGHTSVMEAEKLADVIVVYDVSGSMNYRMDSETAASAGERRMDYAQTATKALANALLGKNTTEHPELIRMALISFSNTATKYTLSSTPGAEYFTTDLTTYNDAVEALPAPNGGTNWEYALQLANEMAVESDRATFVVFVTDGNPTFRQTRGVLNNNGTGALSDNDMTTYYFAYNVFGVGSSDKHERNYAAALAQAQSIVSHNKNFYTIGISNDVTNLNKLTTEAGAGADHSKTAASEAELVAAFDDIAASIIAHLGHSDIQITDGITDLTQTVQKSSLVSFAEDDFTYYKGEVVVATQADVDAGLAAKVGDPIPATQADVDAGLATVVGGPKVSSWEAWNPTSEGCAEAEYDAATGAVKWNMGATFMLKDGYTYQVRFKVWPSQEAYDLLADLNNGVKSYASLTDEEKAQISEPATAGGMYTLKTNGDTSYTYREATESGGTVTPTGDPSTPGSFPDVDPLELTTKPLKIKKQWHHNHVDNRTLMDSVIMELYGVDADGVTSHDFKEIILSKYKIVDGHYVDEEGNPLYYDTSTGKYKYANGTEGTPVLADTPWYAENNYVSYGLVTYDTATNAGEKVYETGHDFTLRETDDEAHYYELTTGIYRPMFINGTPTILERLDSAPAGMSGSVFHYSNGTEHYYRLNNHIYRDTGSDILLIATNGHRSYMDLNKAVVDEYGAAAVDDTEFEYKIRFTVPDGIANYDTVEKYIWFSVFNEQGQRLNPSLYEHSDDSVLIVSGNYLVATSGVEFTLKIKQGWNVRFLNLPNGTTYSFEEINIPTGHDFVKAEVSGTRWIASMGDDGVDHGHAVDMTGLPANTSHDDSNTSISGTIDFANARYNTTYTNTTATVNVSANKAWQNADGTANAPDGAKVTFGLFRNGETEPLKTLELDGAVDADLTAAILESSPWVAEFRRLLKYDEDGHEISYTIKEIPPYPVGYYPTSDAAVSSGGTITNAARALAVSKTVDGNLGSKDKEFSFTLTMEDMAGKTVECSVDGGARQPISFDAGGKTEFTLRHAQTIAFYAVSGAYTVTETTDDGYTTAHQVDGAAAESGKTVAGTLQGDQTLVTLAFSNTLDTAPPTGIYDSMAFALIGLGAAAGLMAVACLGRGRKQHG